MTGLHSSILSMLLRKCQGLIVFLEKPTFFIWRRWR